ncbi:MAG: hypothetical protein JWR04_936 [Rhodoglobus sp.]|nr:hypothetical protein [Rhodoglobus sp.]
MTSLRAPIALALAALLALSGCTGLLGPRTVEPGGYDPSLGDPIGDDTLEVLGIYAVEGDEIIGSIPSKYEAVWNRFTELFPAETHPEITLFVAIDAEASDNTDGAMQPNLLHPGEQYLALDTTGFDSPSEADRTMIHEFGHLLTLRKNQVPLNLGAYDCDVYNDGTGCPLPTSYLYAWESEFWPGQIDVDESDDAIAERHVSGGFVSEYAATNPYEDVAESFAEWVLDDEVSPAGGVIGDKLRFFDAYPEVVALKEEVRAAL